MHPEVVKISRIPLQANIIFLTPAPEDLPKEFFSKDELSYITRQNKKDKQDFFSFNRLDNWLFILLIKAEENPYKGTEKLRKSGDKLGSLLNELKQRDIILYDKSNHTREPLAFTEGLVLGQYQFLKYKGKKEKENTLQKIRIFS